MLEAHNWGTQESPDRSTQLEAQNNFVFVARIVTLWLDITLWLKVQSVAPFRNHATMPFLPQLNIYHTTSVY